MSIDSIAGPSEITVLADASANAHYVAADLLSQAEHDEMASAILVTTSRAFGEAVSAEIDAYLEKLSRREIIEKSLDNFGYILVAASREEAIAAVNAIAPEHLEIVMENPFEVMTKIRNAGAIFLENTAASPWAIILRGPTMCCPPTDGKIFLTPVGG